MLVDWHVVYHGSVYVKNDGFGAIGEDITHNVKINYTSIEIPVGLRRYIFLNKTSKIFINAAYVLGLAGKSNFDFTNSSDNNIKMVSGARNNLALGVGYNFKNKFSVEIRTNTGRQILSDYISWSAKYSSTGIVLGYKIL